MRAHKSQSESAQALAAKFNWGTAGASPRGAIAGIHALGVNVAEILKHVREAINPGGRVMILENDSGHARVLHR